MGATRDPGLLYAGQWRDAESGLCYNRFRYYEPESGMYLVSDPLGHTVRREYDERNWLTRLYNENGEMYRFIRGVNDRLYEEQGLDGVITRYEYDECDRVISKTWAAGTPDALVHSWQYDPAGNVTEKRTQDGRTVYHYSTTGNLTEVLFYPAGHDESGEALSPRKVKLSYDRLGRLTAEENNTGRVSYELDALGNRTVVQLPDGRHLKTLYYGSGHALSISLDDRLITEFSRDNLHREISRTQGGSLTLRTRYDRLGRPERREIYRQEESMRPAEAWHWQYDSRHNLLSETQICDYRYQGYSYDEADHILRQDTSFRGSSHWQYDAAGNQLETSQSGQALKHNQQHQLRQKACVYDVYGRLIQKPGAGGIWYYRYDSEHRMTEAVMEAPTATGTGSTRHEVNFSYDPLGRRTEKRSVVKVYEKGEGCVKATQQETRFVWEGLRLLAEERNGLPLVYVYEDAGSYTPLARIYGSGEKQRVDYYRCGQNGLPQALTDEEGQLHWCLEADVWGETRAEYADESGHRWSGKWSHSPEENLRFAGQYLDRETGLHYNTFRYYAPDMGRFITPDPVGLAGGLNLYQYAPNPLTWIDPLGLRKCSGGFSSADDAARAALNKYNPMSIFKNREYGGIIYRAKDGSYGYTRGRLGTRGTTPSFKASAGGLPKGSTPVGQYHTHGDYSDDFFNRTNKAGDKQFSDIFSPEDIRIHNNANRTFPGYTDALGTPSGGFWKIFGHVNGPSDATPL